MKVPSSTSAHRLHSPVSPRVIDGVSDRQQDMVHKWGCHCESTIHMNVHPGSSVIQGNGVLLSANGILRCDIET